MNTTTGIANYFQIKKQRADALYFKVISTISDLFSVRIGGPHPPRPLEV